MLKIPAIDLIGGRCVRLVQGDYERKLDYAADPVGQALRFQAAGFQRIHVIDLEGAKDGEGRNREAIRRLVQASRVPVQVGGGIRTDDDVAELVDAGAAYLIVGTTAVRDPGRVDGWVARWGAERFIVSLDLRKGRIQVEGWTEESRLATEDVLKRIEAWGMKELISTDVERDGTLEQPNYETYRALVKRFEGRLGVIAAGGVGRP